MNREERHILLDMEKKAAAAIELFANPLFKELIVNEYLNTTPLVNRLSKALSDKEREGIIRELDAISCLNNWILDKKRLLEEAENFNLMMNN